MSMRSMNGDGEGFEFDLPEVPVQKQVLPAKPDVAAAPAETADLTVEKLEELLGLAPDAIEWEEMPGAAPVQPDEGQFDPPSKDDIQLPE